MKRLTRLISKLFAVLLLIPSLVFAISLDSQSDNLNTFEIDSVLTTRSWDSLDKQKLDCRKILQSREQDPAVNACVAAAEMKQQQWQKASKYWQVALKNHEKKDSIKAGYYLGLVLSELKRNKTKNAQKAAQKALSFVPDSISLRYWLARSFELDNKPEKAASEYERITAIVPPRKAWLERYYHASAIVKAAKQARYAYAKTELLTFLKHNPDYYGGITLLAYIELLLGDVASAINNLNKAERLIPSQPFVQRLLSQAYLIKGDLDRAIQSGKRLLRIKPKDVTGNYLVGAAYLRKGDTAKGVIYMNRVSFANPQIKEAKVLLAVSYLSRGQLDKVIEIVDDLLKSETSNLAVELSLLRVLIQLGRYEDAVSRSRDILKKQPDPLVKFLQSKALFKQGKAIEAEKQLLDITQKKPQFSAAQIELIRVYMMQAKFSDANFVLNKYLAKWPSSASAYALRGDLMVFMKKTDPALKSYRKAVQLDVNSLSSWKKLLQYLVQQGLMDEANEMANKLVVQHPGFADGYFFKAVVAFAKKDTSVAEKMFKKTLSLKPDYYKALNHLGLLAVNDGQAALEYFKKSLAINNRQPVIYGQMANLYLALGDRKGFSGIVKQWKNALPKSSMPYEFMGKRYRKLGDLNQAVAAFEEAIKISPKKSVNYLMLGDTYKRLKDFKRSILLYKAALKAFPDSPVFLNNLAGSYVKDSQYDSALNFALKAEKFAPDSWKIKDTVAQIYYFQGKYKSAIKKYRQALSMNKNSYIAFHLAKAYNKSGDADEARKFFGIANQNQSLLSSEERLELTKYLADS